MALHWKYWKQNGEIFFVNNDAVLAKCKYLNVEAMFHAVIVNIKQNIATSTNFTQIFLNYTNFAIGDYFLKNIILATTISKQAS